MRVPAREVPAAEPDWLTRRIRTLDIPTLGVRVAGMAPIRPPSRLLRALEGRALWEAAALLPALPLLATAPRGDGHTVLVLPGLGADDGSTRILRRFLRDRGYDACGWRLGRNVGPTPEILRGLGLRFAQVRDRQGGKLSLIGWSLGGVYARGLARRFAPQVRCVIRGRNPRLTGRLRAVPADQLPVRRLHRSLHRGKRLRYHVVARSRDT